MRPSEIEQVRTALESGNADDNELRYSVINTDPANYGDGRELQKLGINVAGSVMTAIQKLRALGLVASPIYTQSARPSREPFIVSNEVVQTTGTDMGRVEVGGTFVLQDNPHNGQITTSEATQP